MALSWNETVDLLTLMASTDRRTVSENEITFWKMASTDGDWPSLRFAVAAVVKHVNEEPGVWIYPGHITKRWHALREEINSSFNYGGPTREVSEAGEEAITAHAMAERRDHEEADLDKFCDATGVPKTIAILINDDIDLQLP